MGLHFVKIWTKSRFDAGNAGALSVKVHSGGEGGTVKTGRTVGKFAFDIDKSYKEAMLFKCCFGGLTIIVKNN